MSVKINKRLNLVVPVEVREGVTYYFHSTPLMNETFELYYKVMAKAFTDIYTSGLSYITGPRVAMLALKDCAKRLDMWEGPEGVENGLLPEIQRLTNVVLPGPGGAWQTLPVTDNTVRDAVSEEDLSEVDNAIVFFMLASAMHKRAELRGVLKQAVTLWGGQLTLLNATAYAASLPTLTTGASTGATVTVSSIPS